MKTLKNKFWALLLITSVAFLSCKKEDRLSPLANTNNTNTTIDEARVNQEDWKITRYQIGDKSEVKRFSDYLFRFRKGDIIQAVTNQTVYDGVWQPEKIGRKVIINFKSAPLSDLSATWDIINQSNYAISLEHINKNGQKVSLRFQRLNRIEIMPAISAEHLDFPQISMQ